MLLGQLLPQVPSGFLQVPSGFLQVPSGFQQVPSGCLQVPSGFLRYPAAFPPKCTWMGGVLPRAAWMVVMGGMVLPASCMRRASLQRISHLF